MELIGDNESSSLSHHIWYIDDKFYKEDNQNDVIS